MNPPIKSGLFLDVTADFITALRFDLQKCRNHPYTKWARVVFLLVLMTGTGCSNQNPDGIYSSVSISPDDRLICYANSKGGNKSIYIVDRVGAKVGEITIPNDQTPLDPIFSPDGKKILYLSRPKNSDKPQSAIYLADIGGGNPICLTPGTENVTEAVFSPDGKIIYFLNAGFFGHYSPIVGSRPHDFDVYSVDITGKNPKQWTAFKAYGMFDLMVSNDGNNLFFVKMDQSNTLYNLPLTGNGGAVSLVSDIWDATVSPDKKALAFTQMNQGLGGLKYELYLSNLDLSNASVTDPKQLTALNSRVFAARFFNQRPYILFIQQKNWPNTTSPQYRLMEVKQDGTDLKEISLPK